MLCPYCLENINPEKAGEGKTAHYRCSNPQCRLPLPNEYLKNPGIGREVVNAIGFSRHGKTVYFACLFYMFNHLAEFWPGFATLSVDENSLNTVKENIKLLDQDGVLPNPTQKNFPMPTVIRLSNLPTGEDKFFLFYDTGGESYRRAQDMVKFAGFVKNSRVVNFFISLSDLDNIRDEIHELLQVYIQGITDLGGNSNEQHLIVVLTKGDRLKGMPGKKWNEIWNRLENSSIQDLDKSIFLYMCNLKILSRKIEEYFREEIKAHQFLNLATSRFKSVEFCILSSLGSPPAPDGRTLQTHINPKRVIDPLVWLMFKDMPDWKQAMFDWRRKMHSIFKQ